MNILRPPQLLENGWLLPLRVCWFLAMLVWLTLRTVVFQPLAYLLSLPFRPIMAAINLATHWAGDQPSKKWIVLFAGSLGLSLLTVLPFIGGRSEIAMSYVGSLLVHEMFHGYGYYRAKVPFYIIFIGFLGAAAVSSDSNYHKMRHWDKSIMLLLGPTGSLLVAVFWWILSLIDPQNASTYRMLAGFNLTLVLFNMIALGGLDGGRIYLSMMASLREQHEKYVAFSMILVSVLVLGYAFMRSFRFELIIFFLLWMIIGFIKTMGKDNPTDYLREPAMKTRGILIIMFLYLTLFTVSSFLYLNFPDWSPLVVIDPFVISHLPEILMFLVVVGIYVLATDMTHWKLAHLKYKTCIEFLVVVLIIGVSLIPAIVLVEWYVPISAIWVTYVIASIAGSLSMRGIMAWKKIRDDLLSKQPTEPPLDVFAVVGDTA